MPGTLGRIDAFMRKHKGAITFEVHSGPGTGIDRSGSAGEVRQRQVAVTVWVSSHQGARGDARRGVWSRWQRGQNGQHHTPAAGVQCDMFAWAPFVIATNISASLAVSSAWT